MNNNLKSFSFFLLLSLTLYSLSCTSDKLAEPTVGDECDQYDATYDGDVKAIFDETCALAGCHVTGSGVPGVFEDFAGLANHTNDGPNGFRDRVIILAGDPSSGMPPNYSAGPQDLTEEQLEIFRCWVNSGYPEN